MKNMKKLFKIVLVSSLSLLCFSCYYDTVIEEEIPVIDDVSFSADIQPIFTKCTSCHNGNTSPDLREGNEYNSLVPNYVNAGNATTSKLYNYLPGNGHHDVGFTLSATEIAKIKAWIDNGALNN